jgi:ethanolamine utilization protein EutP
MKSTQLDSVVFVGEVDAGKSALINQLLDQETNTGKTQAPIFYPGKVIDTPGEFMESRAMYGALLTTISNVKTIVFLHPANAQYFSSPSGLLTVYSNKNIVGVISKVDAADADIDKSIALLRQNGIPEPYFMTSVSDPASIKRLSHYLLSLQQSAPK